MKNLYDKLLRTKQNKIICMAKNYVKHAQEMGVKDVPSRPVVFTKPWSSLVYEPNPIKLNKQPNSMIDHECNINK